MAEKIGAGAARAASANENARPENAFASFVADGLTPAMRDALRRRQIDMFEAGAVVSGAGMTLKALRRRGVVDRGRVTPLGEMVCAAAGLGSGAHA